MPVPLDALDVIDAFAVRRWPRAVVAAFDRYGGLLDRLNVFPVADGDTGANLTATWLGAAVELDRADAASVEESVTTVASALTTGALGGARGSSGVITAAWLSGLSAGVESGARVLTPFDLRRALLAAAANARSAVAVPVEGTVLTVADAIAAPDPGASIATDLPRRLKAGFAALRATPRQLPVLSSAGVVDAGGAGLVLAWECLVRTVLGTDGAEPSVLDRIEDVTRSGVERVGADFTATPAFEVEFVLVEDHTDIDLLRERLLGLGNALVVVPVPPARESAGLAPGSYRVHIHTTDVGGVLEAAFGAGSPHDVRITALAEEIDNLAKGARVAVVAVCDVAGAAELLTAAGATVVGPSDVDADGVEVAVIAAVVAAGAEQVVVVADYSGADQRRLIEVCRSSGVELAVVSSSSPVQSLAALAVRDTGAPFAAQVVAMVRAAASTRWAEVTVAGEAALTSAGPCPAGAVLGLIGGDVSVIGTDRDAVSREIVDRLLVGGGDLVTVVVGAGDADPTGRELRRHVAARWPFAEFHCVAAGGDERRILLGVE